MKNEKIGGSIFVLIERSDYLGSKIGSAALLDFFVMGFILRFELGLRKSK